VLCVFLQIFRDVGFANVEAEDRTKQFVEMLNKELEFVETNKYKLVPVRTLNHYHNNNRLIDEIQIVNGHEHQ